MMLHVLNDIFLISKGSPFEFVLCPSTDPKCHQIKPTLVFDILEKVIADFRSIFDPSKHSWGWSVGVSTTRPLTTKGQTLQPESSSTAGRAERNLSCQKKCRNPNSRSCKSCRKRDGRNMDMCESKCRVPGSRTCLMCSDRSNHSGATRRPRKTGTRPRKPDMTTSKGTTEKATRKPVSIRPTRKRKTGFEWGELRCRAMCGPKSHRRSHPACALCKGSRG